MATAKSEVAEHMEGMEDALAKMQSLPLKIKACWSTNPNAPTNKSTKTVHFVRHGQGFHNLAADIARKNGKTWIPHTLDENNPYIMPEILDAPLTERGRQEAISLQETVNQMKDKPELIVFSPHCRALQTGLLVFEELEGNIPYLAHEMVREQFGVHVCDKRRPKSRQEKEFRAVDFSMIETEEDVLFLSDRRETKVEVATRAYKFFEWLESRPEKHIGVASHSAWLLTVFNANLECEESLKAWFETGEMRSVVLEFCR
ncbi:unnamed protein product [Cylindrotheca closterium]|uniref:Phosphoglycerate mutase-like protein n=1 Tax=Cylindrotheca closterium TaxID=2856 RepID=A0AAD2CGP8_9STRA|nr:unnamed protein product [Cylindrotheca closterium]